MSMDKGVKEKLLRIFLRSVPILPGPELFDLLRAVKKSQWDVDAQVTDALESIKNTSELVNRLESSLRERSEKLEALQREHERYSELGQIEAKKVEALLSQIETTLGRNVGRERWIAFLINIAAGIILFVLGVVLSAPLKSWLTKLW
ncbi:hypothetical protein [Methylophilus sp. TWE2]|uniref:hypothetical protein n=1 Tax=Methylophilus sp. TWE2 TaxID=1662285 RepID=UPI000670AB93|nr:hypothetical protein [Methylophilus sp. TWE2]AKR43295.1 hypothetical protein ACJ67_07540 [Methylophilus sp. TWE2]